MTAVCHLAHNTPTGANTESSETQNTSDADSLQPNTRSPRNKRFCIFLANTYTTGESVNSYLPSYFAMPVQNPTF